MARFSSARFPVSVVVAGALTGYVLTALVTSFATGSSLSGATPESPAAHEFLTAYLKGDAVTAARYRAVDVATRAMEIQRVERTASMRKITSMTYLGGAESGGIGVYSYVITGSMVGDTKDLTVPFTLTVIDGK